MKFGIIKERKSPPDKRVVFSPAMLSAFKEQFPQAEIRVESSDVRIFKDEEYKAAGFEVVTDVSDCDVLIGVKEVPVDALIPHKNYFFFSHTIKRQPHNKEMLQAIIDNDITLYDHETVTDTSNRRLIGFGRYAGIVGTYNGFRAFGQKYELYELPKAESLTDRDALVARLKRLTLPPIKIVLTGKGKVGMGAKEILDAMKVKEVSADNFLSKKYTEPVYTQIDVLEYNKRKDGNTDVDNSDFFKNPGEYVSDFARFANAADMYIAGHFYGNGAPQILSRDMLRDKNNKIKIVADISCDVEGPVACTLRSSTIAEPFYGYNASTNTETDMHHPAAIVVMAVDNLPCELPRDASEGFGEMFLNHVIPAFYNNDKDRILERSKIAEKGRLTEKFKYLNDYIHENVPHL
ncbi:alanine dehydrogenase [Flavobacterium sp. Sd200]|uniref:NAD(P)-dependent oxidoreductase n=1 Tax=Flavobacterium sp. Sd200 TaxID=2692211 RepID=UPI00136F79AA|nr:NAD(P)-dependent oxidoreductase [Flavobacterium sp. Sd200]MXN90516.1 alanine dehydrogenase [Flavobacterium sp. Sd200]